MSLMDFTKEQKQYLMLGVIVAIVFSGLIIFGIKLSLSSIAEAKVELEDLTEKVDQADHALLKSQQDDAAFTATIAELTAHLANIPPDRNYYSWATEIIYAKARGVLEIDAIDEISMAVKGDDSKDKGAVKLESYSLRIAAHGGYDDIKNFLQQIDRDHPLVRVTGIEISSGPRPDIHDVQLFIEWPFNLGYIAETWKSITAQQRVLDKQDSPANAVSAAPSEPDKSPEVGTDTKKTPPPPAPRSGAEKSQPELDEAVRPIASGTPLAEDT